MTVKELREHLNTLIEQGKGHYTVEQDGYGRDLEMDCIYIDDKKKEVCM